MGRKVAERDLHVVAKQNEEPDIGAAGRICLEAWRFLDSRRIPFAVPLGMGGSAITSGPIPWSEVKEWCEWRGLDRDATAIVASVLLRLDGDRGRRETARIVDMARAAATKK